MSIQDPSGLLKQVSVAEPTIFSGPVSAGANEPLGSLRSVKGEGSSSSSSSKSRLKSSRAARESAGSDLSDSGKPKKSSSKTGSKRPSTEVSEPTAVSQGDAPVAAALSSLLPLMEQMLKQQQETSRLLLSRSLASHPDPTGLASADQEPAGSLPRASTSGAPAPEAASSGGGKLLLPLREEVASPTGSGQERAWMSASHGLRSDPAAPWCTSGPSTSGADAPESLGASPFRSGCTSGPSFWADPQDSLPVGTSGSGRNTGSAARAEARPHTVTSECGMEDLEHISEEESVSGEPDDNFQGSQSFGARLQRAMELARQVNPSVVEARPVPVSTEHSARATMDTGIVSQPRGLSFRQAPELPQALAHAFGRLKTNVLDQQSMPAPLDLPASGQVRFKVSKPTYKLPVAMPDLAAGPSSMDLPPDMASFKASTPTHVARLKSLEAAVLSLLQSQSTTDALLSTAWKSVLQVENSQPVFKEADPAELHGVLQCLAEVSFQTLNILSSMLALVVAWRRESAVAHGPVSHDLALRLTSAPYSKDGLFGPVVADAVKIRNDASLTQALCSLARQRQPSKPPRKSRGVKRRHEPDLSMPPPKRPNRGGPPRGRGRGGKSRGSSAGKSPN